MALQPCPECKAQISDKAVRCPQCGHPIVYEVPKMKGWSPKLFYWGYEYKTKATLFGWPLVHVAAGRNKETGRLMVAKGIIAIGQFGFGVITIAQFGIGILFGLGQFMTGFISLGQVALGIYFGAGQIAFGLTAIGQFGFGNYVLAQLGAGVHVWSKKIKDPVAVEYFTNLWHSVRGLLGL